MSCLCQIAKLSKYPAGSCSSGWLSRLSKHLLIFDGMDTWTSSSVGDYQGIGIRITLGKRARQNQTRSTVTVRHRGKWSVAGHESNARAQWRPLHSKLDEEGLLRRLLHKWVHSITTLFNFPANVWAVWLTFDNRQLDCPLCSYWLSILPKQPNHVLSSSHYG